MGIERRGEEPMSEDIGAWIREQRFGRILLRTYDGDVLSLDLYEMPDLVCRGVYLPAERRRERPRPLAEIELVADREAQEELSRRFRATGREGEGYFELRTEDMELYGEISPPIESEGRAIWAGTLREVAADRGEFTFLLEQWGSIETTHLLVILGFLVFAGLTLAIAWWRCEQQAVRQCGEGNIKVCKVSLLLGGPSLELQTDCQVKCFQRTSPT
jgi:hypothetical protein